MVIPSAALGAIGSLFKANGESRESAANSHGGGTVTHNLFVAQRRVGTFERARKLAANTNCRLSADAAQVRWVGGGDGERRVTRNLFAAQRRVSTPEQTRGCSYFRRLCRTA